MRENNLLSPHRCRRRGGNPHDGEIITHAPTSCGARTGVRVFTVDDGWGWIFTADRALERRVCRLACSASAATASPPCSRSPWGLPGCMISTRGRSRLGGWPCGWITAPSICRTTSPTRSSSGASSRPTPSSLKPQTNGVAERFNRTLKEQIIHGRIYRNIAELRDAVRPSSNSTMPSGSSGEERLPEPRSSSSGVAHRDIHIRPAA